MFIETLEFTIPVDLCNLCSTLQKSVPGSDLEFPASVNSYGTTQDASIQVAVRANKLTFKVDGVSSNASIISKSECKTLKLSVFDVDRSLIPQDNLNYNSNNVSQLQHSSPLLNTVKRTHDQTSSLPVQAKIRRNSHDSNRKKNKSPNSGYVSELNHRSKQETSNNVIVKIEPDDPDLIEIEPDAEPIKTEEPHTQTGNSNLYPQTSSYERNVPHVPDYAEPSTSQHQQRGRQSADDFLVFQDDNYEGEDNEEDFSNDDRVQQHRFSKHLAASSFMSPASAQLAIGLPFPYLNHPDDPSGKSSMFRLPPRKNFPCPQCEKAFSDPCALNYHKEAIHDKLTFQCVCGKSYKYRPGLFGHRKTCIQYLTLLHMDRTQDLQQK